MSVVNLPIKKITSKKFTWATKPTSPQVGDLIVITDVGLSDELFRWTGTRWEPINKQIVLSAQSINSSVTGTTTNTQLHEVVVPGGLMSPNGQLELMTLWTYTNSANTKNLRVYFGSFGIALYTNRADTTTTIHQIYTAIRNNNSITSQIGINPGVIGGLGSTGNSNASSSVNTALNSSIYWGGQLVNNSEVITLKAYKVTYRE